MLSFSEKKVAFLFEMIDRGERYYSAARQGHHRQDRKSFFESHFKCLLLERSKVNKNKTKIECLSLNLSQKKKILQ